MQALGLIKTLYLHVDPSIGLESGSIYHTYGLLKIEMQRIVNLLVCSEHACPPYAVYPSLEPLARHYIMVMRKVAMIQLSNAQTVHQHRTDLYMARIANDFNTKHPKPNARAKNSYTSADPPQQPHADPHAHSDPASGHKRSRKTRPHAKGRDTPNPYPSSPAVPKPAPRSGVDIFRTYHWFWQSVEDSGPKFDDGKKIDQQIVFPVHTGIAADVTEKAVSGFLREALQSPTTGSHTADKLLFLKKERLRWHPDKIDQRFGGLLGAEKVKGLACMIIQQINRFADAEKAGIPAR